MRKQISVYCQNRLKTYNIRQQICQKHSGFFFRYPCTFSGIQPHLNQSSTTESRPHKNTSQSELRFVKGEHKQTLSSECLSLRDLKNNTDAASGQILQVYTKSPDVLDGPTWSQELQSIFKRKLDLHSPLAPASTQTQTSYPIAPVDKEASLGCNSCLHIQKSPGQSLLLSSGKNALCLARQKKIHRKHLPAGTLKRHGKVPEHLNQTPDDLVQP